MGFLNNSGVNYLWNKVKDYVDSRAIAGNIKQVRTVRASQSSSLSVNTFGNNITINLSSYGFETTPIVVPQAQGWLEPRAYPLLLSLCSSIMPEMPRIPEVRNSH